MTDGQRSRGRPRAEAPEVQRRRILDAARALLSRRGYDATTVAAIAVEAQVARAAVYETVGNKEQIVAAVADELVDDLVTHLSARREAIDTEAPLADAVHDDVTWFLRLVRSDPAVGLVIDLTGSFSGGQATRARQRVEEGLAELYRHRAAQWGLDRGEAARLMAVLILGLMERAAYRTNAELGWPVEDAIQVVADMVVGGVLQVEAGDTALDRFDAAARRRANPPHQG